MRNVALCALVYGLAACSSESSSVGSSTQGVSAEDFAKLFPSTEMSIGVRTQAPILPDVHTGIKVHAYLYTKTATLLECTTDELSAAYPTTAGPFHNLHREYRCSSSDKGRVATQFLLSNDLWLGFTVSSLNEGKEEVRWKGQTRFRIAVSSGDVDHPTLAALERGVVDREFDFSDGMSPTDSIYNRVNGSHSYLWSSYDNVGNLGGFLWIRWMKPIPAGN